jgi:hypothetical protein
MISFLKFCSSKFYCCDYGLAKLFMGVLCKRHSFSWRRACASNAPTVSENVADVNVLCKALPVPCPALP